MQDILTCTIHVYVLLLVSHQGLQHKHFYSFQSCNRDVYRLERVTARGAWNFWTLPMHHSNASENSHFRKGKKKDTEDFWQLEAVKQLHNIERTSTTSCHWRYTQCTRRAKQLLRPIAATLSREKAIRELCNASQFQIQQKLKPIRSSHSGHRARSEKKLSESYATRLSFRFSESFNPYVAAIVCAAKKAI